jgi:hypothetical protein
MPRPHEDLERHVPTDHRAGGAPVSFTSGVWCAVEIAHVKAGRVDAGISTYETLIEQARASAKARAAVVLRSANNRRVIALIEIEGHEIFRHLESAWDKHRLEAERHAVAESSTLALYRVAASAGDMSFDPASKDAYAFERVARSPEQVRAVVAAIPATQGFRGALVLGSDDARASAAVYRFERSVELVAFRESAPVLQSLGPVGAAGESLWAVHPIKTFG